MTGWKLLAGYIASAITTADASADVLLAEMMGQDRPEVLQREVERLTRQLSNAAVLAARLESEIAEYRRREPQRRVA